MKDFENIRLNLIDMLEDLDLRLDKITDTDKPKKEPLNNDVEDKMLAGHIESVDAVAKNTLQDIEKIKQALTQIDQGTFGLCISCGASIQKQQLNKTPFSNLCNQCEIKQNDSKT